MQHTIIGALAIFAAGLAIAFAAIALVVFRPSARRRRRHRRHSRRPRIDLFAPRRQGEPAEPDA